MHWVMIQLPHKECLMPRPTRSAPSSTRTRTHVSMGYPTRPAGAGTRNPRRLTRHAQDSSMHASWSSKSASGSSKL